MADTNAKHTSFPDLYQTLLVQTPDQETLSRDDGSYWNIEASRDCNLSSQYAGPACKS